MSMRPSWSASVPVTSTSRTVSIWLEKRIASGTLELDSQQIALALKLDALIEALRPGIRAAKSSALGWFLSRKPVQSGGPVKGLYIHGGVGRGKTMLMDIFFKRCPDPRKRRVHFNDFMVDVHDRITAHRALLKQGKTKQADPQQIALALKLDALIEALRPGIRAAKSSALGWFLSRKPAQNSGPV